jgi:hypothetical protein
METPPKVLEDPIKFRAETVWEKKRTQGIGGKGCCN